MQGLLENHVTATVIGVLLHATFPAIVFVISANLKIADIRRELSGRWLLVRTFVSACVLVPLVTAAVVKVLDVPLLVGGIMLISAVAPGDPFDLVEAKGKKGSIPVAAVIMPFLVLIMPLMTPFWLWVYSAWFPLHLSVSPREIFFEVAPLTIGPLLAGLTCHEFFPALTRVLQRILEGFFRAAVIVLVLAFIVPSIEAMAKFSVISFVAIVVVITLSLFIGYYSGGANRKDRISLSVTSGLGNLAVILLVAHLCYPRVHVLFSVLAYVIVRWVVFMGWYLYLGRKLRLRGEKLG